MEGHALALAVAAAATGEEFCELLGAVSAVAVEDVERLYSYGREYRDVPAAVAPLPTAARAAPRSAAVAMAGLACVAARSLARMARRATAVPRLPCGLIMRVEKFVAAAESATDAAARCRPAAAADAARFASGASSAHAAVLIAYYDVVIATEGRLDAPYGQAALSPKKRQKTEEREPSLKLRDKLVRAVHTAALTLSSFAVPSPLPRPSDAEIEEGFAAARLRLAMIQLRCGGVAAGPQTVFEHHIGLLNLSVAIRMWYASSDEKWNFVCAFEALHAR